MSADADHESHAAGARSGENGSADSDGQTSRSGDSLEMNTRGVADGAVRPRRKKPSNPAVIGARLRAWRQEAGLSMREVAALSGLSTSFISLVERGETEIAFTRLVTLTDVYGRQVSDVLAPEESEGEVPRPKIDAAEGVRVHRLARDIEIVYMGELSWKMQPFMMTLGSGASYGPVVHAFEEIVLCLTGAPAVVVGDKRIRLKEGDVLHVPADCHHVYANPGGAEARLFTVDLRKDVSTTLRAWAEVQRAFREAAAAAEGPETDTTPEGPIRRT